MQARWECPQFANTPHVPSCSMLNQCIMAPAYKYDTIRSKNTLEPNTVRKTLIVTNVRFIEHMRITYLLKTIIEYHACCDGVEKLDRPRSPPSELYIPQ